MDAKKAELIWIHLLFSLRDLSTCEDLQVRSGSMKILLRIFETYGNQLSGTIWHLVLWKILFPLMEAQKEDDTEKESNVEKKEGLIAIFHGFGALFSNFLPQLLKVLGLRSSMGSLSLVYHYNLPNFDYRSCFIRATVFWQNNKRSFPFRQRIGPGNQKVVGSRLGSLVVTGACTWRYWRTQSRDTKGLHRNLTILLSNFCCPVIHEIFVTYATSI